MPFLKRRELSDKQRYSQMRCQVAFEATLNFQYAETEISRHKGELDALKLQFSENNFDSDAEKLAAQQLHNQLTSGLNDLKEVMRCAKKVKAMERKPFEYDAEYDAILSLPSVTKVSVGNNGIYVTVDARTTIHGSVYNLGRWQIELYFDNLTWATCLLESGTIQGNGLNQENPGLYVISGGFCFGENKALIEEAVSKGDYLTAIRLCVLYMNSFNDGDQTRTINISERIG